MSVVPFELRGIRRRDARQALREVLIRQRLAGVVVRFHEDCPEIWRADTDLPVFDRELNRDGVQMVWARVCVSPLAFLRVQAAINELRGFDVTAETLLDEPLRRDEHLQMMVDSIEARDQTFPTPLIELDREGRLRTFQEGRTRAVAAFYAGIKQMPVYVFLNTDKSNGQSGPADPPSEFNLQAVLEREMPDIRANPDDPLEEFRDRIRTNLGGDPFTDPELAGEVAARRAAEVARLGLAARELGCAALPRVIRDLREEWDENPCHINMGECAIFADAVAERVPEAVIVDNVEWTAQSETFGISFEHAWLECGGRHYDAETPEGVDDWRDLPFFQRHFEPGELADAFVVTGHDSGWVVEPGMWLPDTLPGVADDELKGRKTD